MSMQINRQKGESRLLQTTDYSDGRTKQSFKNETDINKILQRAQKTGTISHLNQNKGRYADFSDYDFQENLIKLTAGRELFDSLPSEIRNEFQQNPDAFFKYVNDPENKDRLGELLPDLAAPGKQNLDVRNVIPADEVTAKLKADIVSDTEVSNSEIAPLPAHKEPLATPPAEKPP